MENSLKHLTEEFLKATETEKIAMLMSFALQLTILMRGEYDGSNRDPRKYSETLHRITSQALAMIVGSRERYPDDAFIDMITAGTEEKKLTQILEQSFAQGKKLMSSRE